MVAAGAPSSSNAFEQGLGDVEDLIERLHRANITQVYSASSPTLAQLTGTTPEPDPLPVSHISGEYSILTVLPPVTEDVPAPGQTGQDPVQVHAASIDQVVVPPIVPQDVPVQKQGKNTRKTRARK
jgi:hypothetical protein